MCTFDKVLDLGIFDKKYWEACMNGENVLTCQSEVKMCFFLFIFLNLSIGTHTHETKLA